MAARQCSSWSDLQPELLGLVLRRLPSLADRVRLRAVCRQWRHHARLEPLPPPLPWLTLLDGTFLSVPDGEVHRLHVPDDAVYNHGSTGNWLFNSDINGMCSLANPFSKAVIQLLDVDDIIWSHQEKTAGCRPAVYLKWVLLSSLEPPSPNSHFAVLIMDSKYATGISICQPPMASAIRVPNHERMLILDIAFFDGKLYALSRKNLFVIDDMDSNYYYNIGKPKMIPSMRCIVDSIDDPGTTTHYRLFAECFFSGTRQRASLPSAKEKMLGKKKTLDKEGSLSSVKKTTRQRPSLPSVFFYTRQRTLFALLLPSVFFYTRQRTLFAECFFLPSVFSLVPEKKHSANL